MSLTCGITGKPVNEPVVTPCGHVYEKDAITKMLANNGGKHPESGEPLSESDLIPIKAGAQSSNNGRGKRPAKRMIADADTAIIDNSLLPDAPVMFVAFLGSLGAAVVVALTICFKLLEHLFLTLVPVISLLWSLGAIFQPEFVTSTLELDASLPVQPIAGLIAVASWGAIQAGQARCSYTKASFLFFVSLISYVLLKDGTKCHVYWSALPFAVGFANALGPSVNAYLHANQIDAVKQSQKVHGM